MVSLIRKVLTKITTKLLVYIECIYIHEKWFIKIVERCNSLAVQFVDFPHVYHLMSALQERAQKQAEEDEYRKKVEQKKEDEQKQKEEEERRQKEVRRPAITCSLHQ